MLEKIAFSNLHTQGCDFVTQEWSNYRSAGLYIMGLDVVPREGNAIIRGVRGVTRYQNVALVAFFLRRKLLSNKNNRYLDLGNGSNKLRTTDY